MITVRNDFHCTEVRVRANIGDTLTESQVKRCRRKLCGIKGCSCTWSCLGDRGPQNGFYVIPIEPYAVQLVSTSSVERFHDICG